MTDGRQWGKGVLDDAERVRCDAREAPALIVVVDTEEEFDWNREVSRCETRVRSVAHIARLQRLLDKYGITPVYVIDYPVASQADGYRPLRELHDSGRCVVGAHLHPWVNPPFEETVCTANSFPGNLSPELEAAKLHVLGQEIAERFGARPVIYKAGRYGLGPHTLRILEDQGFEVDLSVCPHMDYSQEGGPDFRGCSAWPHWFGRERRLLEVPMTVGFSGLLRCWGEGIHGAATRPPLSWSRMVGAMARLRLLDKVWLSPEGFVFAEHARLVRSLLRDGLRVFSFTLHSPSLEPGNTPYVRSERDLTEFLSTCSRFFDFFFGDVGGRPTTPLELKKQLAGGTGGPRGEERT